MVTRYDFCKGHGTQNTFVLLPDLDGTRYPDLTAENVRALCDRNTGLSADGMIRIAPVDAAPPAPDHDTGSQPGGSAEWFMDYRNADGSLAEMCGNGVRVMARYLWETGVVRTRDLTIATRGGDRALTRDEEGLITVGMGTPRALNGPTASFVAVGSHTYPAVPVFVPNPHAVVFVDSVAEAGVLESAPGLSPAETFPDGANIEFVTEVAPGHVKLRVWERGVGETRSCGTGVCAAAWAAMRRDVAPRGSTYVVDVPGGRLTVTERPDGQLLLTGPAELGVRGVVTDIRPADIM
ncbi:MAG TPA: diaminopimelate epimerase [Jiangellaceae bacterium]|nr:diaminopimelate epimerase [Jiangellaceae bacterium]